MEKEETKVNFFLKKSFLFLAKKESLLFLFFLTLLTIGCCLVWYFYIHDSQWNEERKNIYIEAKREGKKFHKEKFNSFLEGAKRREEAFGKTIDSGADIFRLKK